MFICPSPQAPRPPWRINVRTNVSDACIPFIHSPSTAILFLSSSKPTSAPYYRLKELQYAATPT